MLKERLAVQVIGTVAAFEESLRGLPVILFPSELFLDRRSR
jgi:hypothetical protein